MSWTTGEVPIFCQIQLIVTMKNIFYDPPEEVGRPDKVGEKLK